jgi:hypothetical protein
MQITNFANAKIIILIEEIKPWDEIENKLKNLITTHYNDKDELLRELIIT